MPSKRPNPDPSPLESASKRTVNAWSEEDDYLLNKTIEREETLWRRAAEFFNQPPRDLLPSEYTVYTSSSNSLPDLNAPWHSVFCANFITVMLCPIFLGRPGYLREVIRLAMWHRLGDVVPKPRFRWESNPNLQFREHESFIKYLPTTANIFGSDDRRGLVMRDFVAIINAWDEYAEKEGLKSMKEYQKDTRHGLGKPVAKETTEMSREEILKQKKEWIIARRRSNGGQPRGEDVGQSSGREDNGQWDEEQETHSQQSVELGQSSGHVKPSMSRRRRYIIVDSSEEDDEQSTGEERYSQQSMELGQSLMPRRRRDDVEQSSEGDDEQSSNQSSSGHIQPSTTPRIPKTSQLPRSTTNIISFGNHDSLSQTAENSPSRNSTSQSSGTTPPSSRLTQSTQSSTTLDSRFAQSLATSAMWIKFKKELNETQSEWLKRLAQEEKKEQEAKDAHLAANPEYFTFSNHIRSGGEDNAWKAKVQADAQKHHDAVLLDRRQNGPIHRRAVQLEAMDYDKEFRTVCPWSWKVQTNPESSGPIQWAYMHAVPGFTNKPTDSYVSRLMIIFQHIALDWQFECPDTHFAFSGVAFVFQYEEKRRQVLEKFPDHPAAYQQYLVEYGTWTEFLPEPLDDPGAYFPGGSGPAGCDPSGELIAKDQFCHNCFTEGHYFWACKHRCKVCNSAAHGVPNCPSGSYVPPQSHW